MPPMAMRFLPSQEWSTWDGRFVGDFGVVCRHDTVRFLPTQEWSTWGRGIVGGIATVRTQHCEIPAFAGMVCGNGESAADLAKLCKIPQKT